MYVFQRAFLPAIRHNRHCVRLRLSPSITTRLLAAPTAPLTPTATKDRDEGAGAWALFSALEKAKEARYVEVSRLVSSLEALLPNKDGTLSASIQNHEQHRIASEAHTSDPAFCSLPEVITDPSTISGDTVRTLLKATRQGRRVGLATIETILKAASEHFQRQPRILQLPPLQENQQLTVVGDIHGSLSDLEAVLGLTGEPHRNNLIVFNGDLADRGDNGIEAIVIVSALCLAYKDCVYLNRGNHEDLSLSIAYGLAAELQHKYGAAVFRKLSPLLDTFFRSLTLATVVEKDALIVHAGPLPPNVRLSDVSSTFAENDNFKGPSRTIRNNREPGAAITKQEQQQYKIQGIIEALLWSDPIIEDEKLVDYHDPNGSGLVFNVSRGAGQKFDASVVRHQLESKGLTRLVRSHEAVRRGCERYTISQDNQATLNKFPLEFFTVFSASRYPHKEGFNQGALLKLLSGGRHSVVRFATEEDELDSSVTSFNEEMSCSPLCAVDPASMLRSLQGAAVSQRLQLIDSLELFADEKNSKTLPFEEVGNIIIRTLTLNEPGLSNSNARLALARALSIQLDDDKPPETVDLDQCIGTLLPESLDIGSFQEMASFYPWLRAVFEVVDVNHDMVIAKDEWLAAVDAINSKLPKGADPINAEATWKILDRNGDNFVSSSEWDELGVSLCQL